jgi:hypothetical protein
MFPIILCNRPRLCVLIISHIAELISDLNKAITLNITQILSNILNIYSIVFLLKNDKDDFY